ncbi:hypothetical protein BC936DRAFT_146851 [Jimgerdemannia flammicorona]|uniref:Ion transport domain-containing protein n=1 Tax=Jimgerdemannia flammicorona TaxID=994334 RepID=A0A433DLF4_9FUNG|nr:hypothetical protein BC936DRAFT_146851 [Jimgerdemannia flammicorona]
MFTNSQVVLGIVLVYIHSLIAFMFFRNDFDVSKGLHCDSVLQCFVTVLSHGVRAGGGIGDILEPPADGQPFGWRVLFEMSFFLIVVIFLLNVIFGIIFDTFGQLRAAFVALSIYLGCIGKFSPSGTDRSTVQQDMNNGSLLCQRLQNLVWMSICFEISV